MSDFVNKLAEAANANIHLNRTLTEISKEDNMFKLVFTNTDNGKEETVHADYVIMTIPFSTLRYVKIDDSVGLSEENKMGIARLPYGKHSKIGIPMVGRIDLYNQLLFYFNLDDFITGWPGQQALTLFVYGEGKEDLTEKEGKNIGKKHAKIISSIYPGKTIGKPVTKNWNIDPFSQGSYSQQQLIQFGHIQRYLMPLPKKVIKA